MPDFTPFQIPDNFTGRATLPDGSIVVIRDTEQEAQDDLNLLLTEPIAHADGQNRPFAPQEILFLQWLGRFILWAKIMVTGLP